MEKIYYTPLFLQRRGDCWPEKCYKMSVLSMLAAAPFTKNSPSAEGDSLAWFDSSKELLCVKRVGCMSYLSKSCSHITFFSFWSALDYRFISEHCSTVWLSIKYTHTADICLFSDEVFSLVRLHFDWFLVLVISFADVTLPRLKAFIPQLLSRLHIEALLHGNITKEVGQFFFFFLNSMTSSSLRTYKPVSILFCGKNQQKETKNTIEGIREICRKVEAHQRGR